jgi:hypothetical protein
MVVVCWRAKKAALGSAAAFANSLTHRRAIFAAESHTAFPVLHSLWINIARCGQAMGRNRRGRG